MVDAISKANVLAQIEALTNDGEFSQQDVNYLINYLTANGNFNGAPRDLIQIRRGNVADLPNLAQGEMAFTLDDERMYIGGLNSNVAIPKMTDIEPLGTVVNPKNYPFNAKGNDSTDDTASLQSALDFLNDNGGGTLFIPNGTYLISAPLVGYSNVHIVGESRGNAIIKATKDMEYMIGFISKSNFSVDSMTLNFDNKFAVNDQTIAALSCSNFVIRNNNFINISNLAVALNAVTDFTVIGNLVERATTSNSVYNVGLVISIANGASRGGVITRNVFNRCSTNIAGYWMHITDNEIKDFGCGAGIVTEQGDNFGFVIARNIIHGGMGVDVNGYTCGGIEVWAHNTVITENLIYNNGGCGIDFGSPHSICSNNIIRDNGRVNGLPGIAIRYGNATYNANYSVIVGNSIFNSNPSVGHEYGILDESTLSEFVVIGKNQLKYNKLGPMNIKGQNYDISTPNFYLTVNQPDAVTVTNGNSSLIEFPVVGARLGDIIRASCDVNTSGLSVIPYVNATNNVQIRLVNNTGASVTLPSNTKFHLVLEKPLNYSY